MSTSRQMTPEELHVAEMAVALVEERIRHRVARCTYCEKGPDVYKQVEAAIKVAFRDVYDHFRRIKHGITRAEKQVGGPRESS